MYLCILQVVFVRVRVVVLALNLVVSYCPTTTRSGPISFRQCRLPESQTTAGHVLQEREHQ